MRSTQGYNEQGILLLPPRETGSGLPSELIDAYETQKVLTEQSENNLDIQEEEDEVVVAPGEGEALGVTASGAVSVPSNNNKPDTATGTRSPGSIGMEPISVPRTIVSSTPQDKTLLSPDLDRVEEDGKMAVYSSLFIVFRSDINLLCISVICMICNEIEHIFYKISMSIM